jgi:hypothetical protein
MTAVTQLGHGEPMVQLVTNVDHPSSQLPPRVVLQDRSWLGDFVGDPIDR